jgi:mannose-6-phosphate isomerase-like protein (cupin superfamily)
MAPAAIAGTYFKSEVGMNTLKNACLGLCIIAVVMGCAAVGSAAQQGSSSRVQYYPQQQVAAAFAKGEKLVEGSAGHAAYQVLTARRDGPGEVEVHALDTDIIYVIKGTATFVTGGKVVDARNTAPNEVRGKSSQGGTPHHLGPEDIIIIPHGVPHWFEAVQPPFLYLVIKVR